MAVWDRFHFKSAARRGCPEKMVQEFEGVIGAALPQDYREFVRSVNGGAPDLSGLYAIATIDWQGKPCSDTGVDAILQYLFVIEEWKGIFEGERNEALTLDWAFDVRVNEQNVLPPGLIPFGCDPSGNQFVLDIAGNQPGSVWFWSAECHDHEIAKTDPYHSLGFLASTFSDFLSKIRFEDF